jgi:8-oxo-dGTP pyrophosphatase MutT (NUDIX family)
MSTQQVRDNQQLSTSSMSTQDLCPVIHVPWDDPEIQRAGIIPIHNDGQHIWVCVVITREGSVLSLLGGEYDEHKDHNLLDTAKREYHEEIGHNLAPDEFCTDKFPLLTNESLAYHYAIRDGYSWHILLPMEFMPTAFETTDELADIVWLTIEQLYAMSFKQDYTIGKFKFYPFLFSSCLTKALPKLHEVLQTDKPFRHSNNHLDVAVNQINISKHSADELHCGDGKVYSLADMKVDLQAFSRFRGYMFLAMHKDVFGVQRRDGKFYMLSKEEIPEYTELAKVHRIPVLMMSTRDEEYVQSIGGNIGPINNLERLAKKYGQGSDLYKNTIIDIHMFRTANNESSSLGIQREIEFMIEKEWYIYINYKKKKRCNPNRDRFAYLQILKQINSMILSELVINKWVASSKINATLINKRNGLGPLTVLMSLLDQGVLVQTKEKIDVV